MDNRNIYGFALFTFIVLTTALVNCAFFAAPLKVKVAPPPPIPVTETTYSCRTKVVPQKIEQAVLDLDSKMLELNLNFGNQLNYSPEYGVGVALHFYTKSPQPKKIGTEVVWFKSNSVNSYNRSSGRYAKDATTIGLIRTASSAAWANNLRKNQSVYVIAKVGATTEDAKNAAVEFNEAEAAPVLLYSNK